jgi:hypothetical protein
MESQHSIKNNLKIKIRIKILKLFFQTKSHKSFLMIMN